MRIVDEPLTGSGDLLALSASFVSALYAARRESLAAFGRQARRCSFAACPEDETDAPRPAIACSLSDTLHKAVTSRCADRRFGARAFVDVWPTKVQIVGDRYGDVVHMFERECSIQRVRDSKRKKQCIA